MWRFMCCSVFFVLAFCNISNANAELNLAQDAHFTVSGSSAYSLEEDYAITGVSALTDDRPFTLWQPDDTEQVFIDIDLGENAINAEINLDRIEIDWGAKHPKSVMVSAGPDSHTQTVLANITITDPDTLTVKQAASISMLRNIRLVFSTNDFSIANIAVYASKAKEIGEAVYISGEMQNELFEIEFTDSPYAHHFEIERTRNASTTVWTTKAHSTRDLPQNWVTDQYRVRAIDYLGNPSPWSETLANTGENLTNSSTVAIRAVAEAFDSYPWSSSKRNFIIRWMGNWQFTHYFYAPADDSKRKAEWRKLYSAEELEDFAGTIEQANANNINFVYCISPGKDIKPALSDDFDSLTSQLNQMLDLGVKDFALLLDDSEAVADSSLGQSHSTLVNKLYNWLIAENAEANLFFKGAIYAGTDDDFDTSQSDYLNELKNINSEVAIIWTGANAYNESISSGELDNFSTLVDHRILLFDNYPINDGEQQYLHLNAVKGRKASLFENAQLAGVSCVAMQEGLASLFAISAYASLFNDPQNYDAEGFDFSGAGFAIDADILQADWQLFTKTFSNNQLWTSDATTELKTLIDVFIQNIEIGTKEEINSSLTELFSNIIRHHRLLNLISKQNNNQMFSEEITPYIDKLEKYLTASTSAINVLQANIYGQSDEFYNSLQKLTEIKTNNSNIKYNVADEIFNPLLNYAANETADSSEARFAGDSLLHPIKTDANSIIRDGQTFYWDMGLNIAPETEFEIDFDEAFDTSVTEHLLSISPNNNTDGITAKQYKDYWLGVTSMQGDALIVKESKLELCPALSSSTEVTLDVSSQLESSSEINYLVQNNIVVPNSSFSQYSKMDLSGNWKKQRMTLDHRLSFSERDASTLQLMEAESSGAVLPEYDDSQWDIVTLPSVENSMCYPNDPSGPEIYFEGVWFRRLVDVPKGGKDIRLVIGAAGYMVDVWADGLYLGHHEGGLTPLYLSLPEAFADQDQLTLVIRVDNPAPGYHESMIPDHFVKDNKLVLPWHPYTGIIGDIYWGFLPSTQKAAITAFKTIPTSKSGKATLELVLQNLVSQDISGTINIEAYRLDKDSDFLFEDAPITSVLGTQSTVAGDRSIDFSLESDSLETYKLEVVISGASAWSFSDPNLYIIKASLIDANGVTLDKNYQQIGFRTIETTEEGRIKLNGSYTYLPSVSYFEDSARYGQATSWTETFNDLNAIKKLGARMIRTKGLPHQSKTYTIADRLGLLVMAEIPTWKMSTDSYAAQTKRPTALNLWREMIFAHYNHPSIVFWNLCSQCEISEQPDKLQDFIKNLGSDLETNYPDNRLTTLAVGDEQLATDLPDSTSYDILGLELNPELSQDDLTNIIETHPISFAGKSLLITSYGKSSKFSDALFKDQSTKAEEVWESCYDYAIVNKGGTLQKDSFIAGLNWNSAYDHYSLDSYLQSTGAIDMDRFTNKPVAETLAGLYLLYSSSGSSTDNGDPITPPNLVDSGSTCSHSNQASIVFLLLLLVFLNVRQQRRQSKTNQR